MGAGPGQPPGLLFPVQMGKRSSLGLSEGLSRPPALSAPWPGVGEGSGQGKLARACGVKPVGQDGGTDWRDSGVCSSLSALL